MSLFPQDVVAAARGLGLSPLRVAVAHVTFKIGVIDSWGNQNYVEFPAHDLEDGMVFEYPLIFHPPQ